MTHRARLVSFLIVVLSAVTGRTAQTPMSGANATSTIRYATWLRVDSRYPRTLFVGGSQSCVSSDNAGFCPPWIMRSTDGGVTWADLTPALPRDGSYFDFARISAPQLAADGRHLYINVERATAPTPSGQSSDILYSTDAGSHWQGMDAGGPQGYGTGFDHATLSSLSVRRLYATYIGGSGAVVHSDDGGLTWRGNGYPGDVSRDVAVAPLVADPQRLDTVYANVIISSHDTAADTPTTAMRSDDAGAHWVVVPRPRATPPLQSFAITNESHEGALLVGRTRDGSVPDDRLYLSATRGRTWRAATCPGDDRGTCPTFIVDNVFGRGASYAFVGDGIYRFHGAGRAEARLPIGDRLPDHGVGLLAIGAGTRAGDPVYLLTQDTLYRSADAGRSWQRLPVAQLSHGWSSGTGPAR